MEMEMLAEDEQRHPLPAPHDLHSDSTTKPQEAMEAYWPFGDHMQAAELLAWAEEHATLAAAAGSPTEAGGAAPDARSEHQQQHEEDVAFWESLYPVVPDMAFDVAFWESLYPVVPDMAFSESLYPDLTRGDGGFRFDVGGGGADEDESTDSTAPMVGIEIELPWGEGLFYIVDDVEEGDDTAAAAGVVAPPIDLELRL